MRPLASASSLGFLLFLMQPSISPSSSYCRATGSHLSKRKPAILFPFFGSIPSDLIISNSLQCQTHLPSYFYSQAPTMPASEQRNRGN
ncbi:hypothetical protein SLEP1_g26127 [Rubroshorea leprosula]|uniref:Secreted protein n=1 Tax=Rubroshorea leprosula TaxID=152421 RepID=A0AAV5JXA0_9ROSI|nr:hypothetical protein SLEP1_g26127 [Rubroshorea leprosula]